MKRTRLTPRHMATLVITVVWGLFTLPAPRASALPQGTPWQEQGEAGSLPASAQVVKGIGPVSAILGRLDQPQDEDIYRICITGGKSFSATTIDGATFDTQLFLFNRSGVGVYANDDSLGVQSTLPAEHPLTPQAGGKYYLAISSYDNDPLSSGGLTFPSFPFDEVFGPIGPGGQSPLIDWTNNGFSSGDYSIAVTGARSCGGPTG